jgi:hypothetical protein
VPDALQHVSRAPGGERRDESSDVPLGEQRVGGTETCRDLESCGMVPDGDDPLCSEASCRGDCAQADGSVADDRDDRARPTPALVAAW